jgi:hypothetical protein
LRSHNATSAEERGNYKTTQTTCTLANNASGQGNEQRLYIARHNVGAAGSPKKIAFWGAMQYVVKVVVLKKEMVLSTTFALAQRHERREINKKYKQLN